jgi:hypothetical protein
MQARHRGPGILLIILGILLLAGNLGYFSLLDFWPLLIVLAGILFLIQWFGDRANYGLLLPSTILIVTGLLFLYCQLDGWYHMGDLWPIFIIAPGAGFILMYLAGDQDAGLLVPGGILLAVGTVFLSANEWAWRWWPALLIVAGALILLRPPRRSTVPSPAGAPEEPPPDLKQPIPPEDPDAAPDRPVEDA